MSATSRQNLLVIGGGRWARVYLSVLAGLDLPHAHVVMISRHGGAALDKALAAANARVPGRFSHVSDLKVALKEPVGAAIIANAARDHVRTAETLLECGIPVLVEKPVALSKGDAARLADLARARGVRLMPGHVLSHCTYLKNFIAAAKGNLGAITSIEVTWRDPADESRYGESKTHDWGLNMIEDIGPHIATIIGLMEPSISTPSGEMSATGPSLKMSGHCNHLKFSAHLDRGGPQRERMLVLRNDEGGKATLDFSIEPGIMTVGGASANADPEWTVRPSPLTLQVRRFLDDQVALENELSAIRETTSFVARLAGKLRDTQQHILEAAIGSDPAYALTAMREVIAPRAVAEGRLAPGDNAALDALARAALARLGAQPGAKLDRVFDEILRAH